MTYKKAQHLLTIWRDFFDADHFAECQDCKRNLNGVKILRCNSCQDEIEFVDSLIEASHIVTKQRLLPLNSK